MHLGFLYRDVYLAKKAYVASHFVLDIFGHVIYIYIYIYIYIFDTRGCAFYGFRCESFYDDVK